jgi:hypothetical protein
MTRVMDLNWSWRSSLVSMQSSENKFPQKFKCTKPCPLLKNFAKPTKSRGTKCHWKFSVWTQVLCVLNNHEHCMIWCFHSAAKDDQTLVGYDTYWLVACYWHFRGACCFHRQGSSRKAFLLISYWHFKKESVLLEYPELKSHYLLWNISTYLLDTASYLRRFWFSNLSTKENRQGISGNTKP